MAYKNDNSVQEDVLFKIQDNGYRNQNNRYYQNPNFNGNFNQDVNTEVLFRSGFEDNLEFQEPKKREDVDSLHEEKLFADDKTEVVEELLFDNNGLMEESISFSQPGVLEESVSPIVELNVVEPVKRAEPVLSEEHLTFSEPLRPDLVAEEVLFEEVEEPSSLVGEIDYSQTIVSDELSSLSNVSLNSLDLVDADVKPKYIEKNFAKKLLEADKEILARYDELKNFMLLYKGVKSRVSNDFDSFNIGRTQLIKLGFSTQSLKLFLNLEYDKVETRLKCKDASHKKAYKEVPVFLRIKSPRAMRNAKYLIEQVVKRFELKENPRAVYVDSIKILEEKAKSY